MLLNLVLSLCLHSLAAPWAPQKPKLIVFMVIDQFRTDYLSRYRSEFRKDGFRALIDRGAYFPYGEYDVLQAMTCPGHATVLTGAYPYQMGIPINDWYDQTLKKKRYCVEDPDFHWVGSETPEHSGTSPQTLHGTTLTDELKNSGAPSRVISFALKDRAAILMGGHRPDFSFWLDHKNRRFVSSDYYLKDKKLPDWIESLNRKVEKSNCDYNTSCGVELTVDAFESVIKEFKNKPLKNSTDFISLSFSTHDYAGHRFGPNSPEIHDVTLAEDLAVSRIRKIVETQYPGGLKNVLFVLTGDHGVSPSPEYLKDTGIDSGRIDEKALVDEMNSFLNKKYKTKTTWVPFSLDLNFFIDEKVAEDNKIDLNTVARDIKQIALKNSAILYAFTEQDVLLRQLPPVQFERQILKTYLHGRSGHVVGIHKPYYIVANANHTSHMSGYTYDRTVPIIFSGFGIKSGLYPERVEVIDIAPTLASLLGILPPALSEGKVLKSVFKN